MSSILITGASKGIGEPPPSRSLGAATASSPLRGIRTAGMTSTWTSDCAWM